MNRLLVALCALVLLALAPAARAHEVRPAYLEIRQTSEDRYQVTWKQPVMGELAIRLVPHLSNGWLEGRPGDEVVTPTFLIRTWTVHADGAALDGRDLAVEGLERSITDVLVRATLADGRTFETILRPDRPQTRIAFPRAGGLAVPAYFQLGVEHILTGVDHLMFVLGLLLLVGLRWRLVKAVTAFTAAHSITLGASAIGLVRAPAATIEALVALSIVFVAAELVSAGRGRLGLTGRQPWLIAFAFGLLHGFAFAGALAEVGLPPHAIPLALLLFNLGVEAGQLLFVAAAILAILALRPLASRLPAACAPYAPRLAPYAIGSFAAFWFLQRAATALA